MGLLSINYLPPKTNKSQVSEFLQILGFKKITETHLYNYDENNLERVTDIVADITYDKDKKIKVEITSTIWRSILDHEIHNFTIKQMKLRFKGNYWSSNGSNRYLVFDDVVRRKSEAGCYLAHFHFSNNLSRINYYIQTLRTQFGTFKESKKNYHNPASTHTTIGQPFLKS